MKNYYLSLIAILFLAILSCSSVEEQGKTIAIRNCTLKLIANHGKENDVKIICPCVVDKMLVKFNGDKKKYQHIIKWELDSLIENRPLLSETHKLFHSCIHLPDVENSENYSDYSPEMMNELKLFFKLGFPDHTSAAADKFSSCVLKKLMQKYTATELYSNETIHPLARKDVKTALEILKQECMEVE